MTIKEPFTKTILLAISVFLSAFYSFAQNVTPGDSPENDLLFERIELPGGPSGNSIAKMIQDSLGYMWFGSQAGLHRYDGTNFITYSSDPINQNTLNSDYIEDICLDRSGIIWLTHWSGGGITALNPDQESFTRFTTNPDDPESILPGETSAIIEGSEGDIWIAGTQGLSRLNKESGKFKRYSHDPNDPNSLSNNDVRGLYVDKDGVLWVATGMPWDLDDAGGLNRYDARTDSFKRFLHDPNDPTTISNNKVRAMYEDSQGNFWVGTAGDGLHLFDKENQTFRNYPFDPQSPGKLSMPFLQGTDATNSSPWSHISSITEDRDQRLWITAVSGGVNVYDPNVGVSKHFEAGEEDNMLKSNFIWQTYQSDDGTIWITTAGEGKEVYKVKEKEFKFPFYHFEELGDSLGVYRGILKDPQGSTWIAQSPPSPDFPIMRSSLWKVDKNFKDIEQVKLKPGSASPTISSFMGSISLDRSGQLWAGTQEGYFIGDHQDGNFKKFLPEIGPPDQWWMYPILLSTAGDIWISFWGHGVIRYDPENEEYEIFEYNPDDPNSISGPFVWSIYEDKEGDIWVGGGDFGGNSETPLFLDRFDPSSKSFEPFITRNLPFGLVCHMITDPNGNLWFSDWNYGLYRLNPTTRELKQYSSGNSLLPGSRIQSILQHPGGNIWIATDYELIEFDPISETFSIYDEGHGVMRSIGSTCTGAITEDGDLMFVRYGGLHVFNPDELLTEVKSIPPDLRITGFKLMDDNMVSGVTRESKNILKEPIWRTDRIELERGENTFAFAVACFDFNESESNVLQFMLEGYDRGWRGDVRDGETPFYINVSPGTYTFRLRGANGLGVWDMEGISLDIIIHPPWWQTWWAYASYGLIFIGGVFGTHKIQRRRLIVQERQRTQQKELQQAREIEKAYNKLKETQQQLIHSEKMASLGELTAGIAHEIQNPLNFVNNFSEVSTELIDEMHEEIQNGDYQQAKSISNDIKQNLEKITYHGKRADSIVKGMLQHSRSSDGKKEPTDINALVDEYLRLAYHGLRAKDKSFNAGMETDFDESLPQIDVVPQEIGRVLLNLLTNAFHAVNEKTSQAPEGYQPKVTVKTKKTDKGAEIQVSDNANGIPEDIKEKIFQPFFTTKATGQGTGLGLSMSYDIVTKGHGGTLNVFSEEGKGTTFTVALNKTTDKR
jgi:signal transduction histidine kinase/ligand-binding sensor domain-containing protein